MRAETERRRSHLRASLALCTIAIGFAAAPAYGVGTSAGREIRNTAQASFDVAGVAQTPIASNSVQTFVDELLDVALVNDDAGPVAVGSPQSGAIVQYTLTNTGNGSESFRLIADDTVAGDVFEPTVVQIYLETNGIPGLQTGSGGDTAYLAGSNDPLLAADASQVVYVTSNIPAGQTQSADGIVELRAVANTIVVSAGTSDPDAAAFPVPGTAYPGQGDPGESGGNVTAVVGTSHDSANPLFLSQATYRVSSAVVTLAKTAVAVDDPFGGATVVPGTVITYRIDVTVSGSGDAQNVVLSDPIPPDLEYLAGSLSVSALPVGEEDDDDFAPLGTDNTGFDGATQTITVNLDTVSGGSPAVSITFQSTVR